MGIGKQAQLSNFVTPTDKPFSNHQFTFADMEVSRGISRKLGDRDMITSADTK